ncbi:MAG TPA: 50S ribosomal protein L10 [Candidatus Nanoarchaeia archaeon]|nr:50S ribosomal protein L10 [Candidatus Nanoarchaeia archaeon]
MTTMKKTADEGVSHKESESKASTHSGLRDTAEKNSAVPLNKFSSTPVKTANKMAKKTPKALELKKKQVIELQKLMDKSKTVGIINLQNSPAKLVKAVRRKMAPKATFVFAKKNIIKRALEASAKERAKDLLPHVDEGIPAIIVSDLDAFSLFRELKSSRQKVPAKQGQIAPEDIKISAGPTPFAPGPAISELASLGLKTKVEGGKIHVRDEVTVVRAGQPVAPIAASILSKLGITPMVIGVNLPYVLEGIDLYTKNILDVNSEQYAQDLKTAALNAFKLALEIGLVTEETSVFMIQKAFREARALSEEVEKKGVQADKT